jgi:putative membrane protein
MPHLHHAGWDWSRAAVIAGLLLTASIYTTGWLRLRASSATSLPGWRAGSFLAGLFSIWAAAASPLATLDHQWLTVHMIQHLLLMTVAPPLIWLASPVEPLLHGLPRLVRAAGDGSMRWAPLRRTCTALAHPAVSWLAATAALTFWHVPAALTRGMQSPGAHAVEAASFLEAGLRFWWPVVRIWTGPQVEPRWSIVLYLFFATLPCDILSGFLVFSERVAYPIYLAVPGHTYASVLADQQCAGALMWTVVTIVYLAAGTLVATRSLSPNHSPVMVQAQAPSAETL